jgi:hypothetical protein
VNERETQLFEPLGADRTGITFKNLLEISDELNVFTYRNFYNGGGVGIGDFNNDGLEDIYFSSNMGPNKLYLNLGNFQFRDITESSGTSGASEWSTGVSIIDINGDGFLDIYVSNAGIRPGEYRNNELFINQGDLTFIESAEEYNLADSGITTHASFFDYDNDGDLDVYLLNNSFIPVTALDYSNKRELPEDEWMIGDEYKGGGDRLLRNEGSTFVDVTKESGIYNSLIGFGLGVTTGDINQDGYIDIFISNDFYERDYLYINNGDGTFSESLMEWVGHTSHSSMGADMADLNNDGFMELFVTDMLPNEHKRLMEITDFEGYDVYRLKQNLGFGHQFMQNSLYWNNRNNTFSEIAYHSGVAATDWSWGALMFDMDLDGYKDIFVANGIYHDLTNLDFMNYFANDALVGLLNGKKTKVLDIIEKMPSTPIRNYAFRNLKGTGRFIDSWIEDFSAKTFSNGSAYADLDNDGDYDLVINNLNQESLIYKNNSVELGKHFLKIELEGPNVNTKAVGTKISLFSNSKLNGFIEVSPYRGFQSSSTHSVIFGIEDSQNIDSVVIDWGAHRKSKLIAPKIDTLYQVSWSHSELQHFKEVKSNNKPTYNKIDLHSDLRHYENHHIDYNYEITALEMLSREGPGVAVADVNYDGLVDVFIGNGFGKESKLYFQKDDGRLIDAHFAVDPDIEVTAAEFIDVNNDGFVDLYVGTGGNDKSRSLDTYFDRIYLNDGMGNFKISDKALPKIPTNTSVISACDFDRDGDIDLFVGNRSLNGIYGVTPKSMLLTNSGDGIFTNTIQTLSPELEEIGMITDAKWIDFDGDSSLDLLVVGDWMAPSLFVNTNGSFQLQSTNLDQLHGWWNTILLGDFDSDGKSDFVLGNKGDNHILRMDQDKIRLFINDFDDNGSIDPILLRSGKKDLPIHTKKEIQSQLVAIRKQLPSFNDYASSTLEDILPKSKLENRIEKQVTISNSIVVFQTQDPFSFKYEVLPEEVQRSSVNSGIISDINEDGFIDLILFGGEDHNKPQFSKIDAGYGELLLNNGVGGFNWVPYDLSGFNSKGRVIDLKEFQLGKQTGFLVFKNNDGVEFYFKSNQE